MGPVLPHKRKGKISFSNEDPFKTQSSVVKRATSQYTLNIVATILVRITEFKDNTYYLIISSGTFLP